MKSLVPGGVAPTFNCFDQGDTRATTVVASQTAVRRLTQRECARLQGFPDGYHRDYAAGQARRRRATLQGSRQLNGRPCHAMDRREDRVGVIKRDTGTSSTSAIAFNVLMRGSWSR